MADRPAASEPCDVFVVGALHLDVIVNAPRLPRLDETLIGSAVAYAFGGKGGNQAAAAARMGARTAMAGRVGSDRFADQLLAALDAAGVDRTQVQRGDGASGMSAAIVDAAGDYGAVVVSAANLDIDANLVVLPPKTGLVVLQNEVPETVNLAVAHAARAQGVPVLLNAAPARQMSDTCPTLVRHLVVNRIEARDLTGQADPEAAAGALIAQGFAEVVITLGADGLVHAAAGDMTRQNPFKVDAVSTHGAGDTFVGALAAIRTKGSRSLASLEFASAAAALHVATPPERRHRITAADVQSFLADRR